MIIRNEDKVIFCYNCLKRTLFTNRDMNNNSGVENHCSECAFVWFEWQNRAVDREKEKWLAFNGGVAKDTNGYVQMKNNQEQHPPLDMIHLASYGETRENYLDLQ